MDRDRTKYDVFASIALAMTRAGRYAARRAERAMSEEESERERDAGERSNGGKSGKRG